MISEAAHVVEKVYQGLSPWVGITHSSVSLHYETVSPLRAGTMFYFVMQKLRLWNIRGIDKYVLNWTELSPIPPGTRHLAAVMTRDLPGPQAAPVKWVQWFLPFLLQEGSVRGPKWGNLYTGRSSWTVSLRIPSGGGARDRWSKIDHPCKKYLTEYKATKISLYFHIPWL